MEVCPKLACIGPRRHLRLPCFVPCAPLLLGFCSVLVASNTRGRPPPGAIGCMVCPICPLAHNQAGTLGGIDGRGPSSRPARRPTQHGAPPRRPSHTAPRHTQRHIQQSVVIGRATSQPTPELCLWTLPAIKDACHCSNNPSSSSCLHPCHTHVSSDAIWVSPPLPRQVKRSPTCARVWEPTRCMYHPRERKDKVHM